MGKAVKRQMSEATKGRALGLLEAGWGVTEVANRVNVSRLKSRKASDIVNDVSPRRKGTGLKKKYGSREVNAIEKIFR